MRVADSKCFLQEISEPILSLPGHRRLSPADVLKEVDEARRYGVNAFMLFPKVEDDLKSPLGRLNCTWEMGKRLWLRRTTVCSSGGRFLAEQGVLLRAAFGVFAWQGRRAAILMDSCLASSWQSRTPSQMLWC